MTQKLPTQIRPIRYRWPMRVLLAASLLVIGHECLGQSTPSSFGAYFEHTLPGTPEAVAVACDAGSGCPEIIMVPRGEPSMFFFVLGDSGTIVQTRRFPLTMPQSVIRTADLDNDGTLDFAALSADGDVLTVVRRRHQALTQTTIPLRLRAKNITVADINNDGTKDVLLYGKSMTGVVTLMGKADGEFERGPGLFSDFSAGDVKVTDINGDEIADVLLISWLSNQLVLFFGIGEDVFSEHVVLDLPSEPLTLSLEPSSRGRDVLVSVAFPERREVHVYSVNAAGQFRLRHTAECPGRPAGAALVDVNNDALPDIVSATDGGVLVVFADSPTSFGRKSIFGIAASEPVWLVADLDGDAMNDLLLADRTSDRMVVAGNATAHEPVGWPDMYLVGREPRGISIADLNNDGQNDIAVANALSSTLSVLLNRGEGKMYGQQVVSVPELPVRLTAVTVPSGSEAMLLSGHPTVDKIAATPIGASVSASPLYVVETGPNPYILDASLDPASNYLSFLVRTREDQSASVSVSLYKQISSEQFLETRYRAAFPGTIKAIAAGDFTGNRIDDLIVVSEETASQPATLSLAPAATEHEFTNLQTLFSLKDSAFVVRDIYPVDLDRDGCLDVVLVGGPAEPKLGIAFGNCDGTFRAGIEWVKGVYPVEDVEVIVKDVNQDRHIDLVFLDGVCEDVVALYGRRGGRFDRPSRVTSGRGVNGLMVGSIRSSQVSDLVLSYGGNGTVSILFSPFTR